MEVHKTHRQGVNTASPAEYLANFSFQCTKRPTTVTISPLRRLEGSRGRATSHGGPMGSRRGLPHRASHGRVTRAARLEAGDDTCRDSEKKPKLTITVQMDEAALQAPGAAICLGDARSLLNRCAHNEERHDQPTHTTPGCQGVFMSNRSLRIRSTDSSSSEQENRSMEEYLI